MGSGFEEKLWFLGKRYEAIAWDLDKPEARRTSEMLIAQGFLARIRIYRPIHSEEKRWVVYGSRPRGMAASQPISIAVEA